MGAEALKLEIADHVAHVRLDRPDVMNALNQTLVDEIGQCFTALAADPQVRVVVLSGNGKAFCAGGDVSFLKIINSRTGTGIRDFLTELFDKLGAVTRIDKPVIGALHGFAMGAGFGLALHCDLRLAAEGTTFGTEFANMGIAPEAGSTHLLPRLVGFGRAMELLLTARRFKADEALAMGLVNRVVPADALLDEAMALAKQLAAMPPLALGMAKRALHKGATSDLSTAIAQEIDLNGLCYQTEDHKEAATAFMEKRKPEFKGR